MRNTRILVEQLLSVVEPDRAKRRDSEAHQRRGLTWYTDSTGMAHPRAQVAGAEAAAVLAAIGLHAEPHPTRAATDKDGAVVEIRDTRSRSQRAVDAFCRLIDAGAVHLAHCPDGSGGVPSPRADVHVTATPEQVATAHAAAAPGTRCGGTTAESGRSGTSSGARPHEGRVAAGLATAERVGPITPATLARLLCGGILRRVLLAPDGGILDVGRTARLATPAQRKALTVRDGGCVIPGCAVPATGCDAHHSRPWSAGGRTDLDHLLLLCPRQHTETYLGHWSVEMKNGVPWATPPPWIDRHRRPLRNTFHRAAHQARSTGEQLRLLLVESGEQEDGPDDDDGTGRHRHP